MEMCFLENTLHSISGKGISCLHLNFKCLKKLSLVLNRYEMNDKVSVVKGNLWGIKLKHVGDLFVMVSKYFCASEVTFKF